MIGLGRIGGTVARKAQGIGMEVAAYDPFLPAAAAGKGSVPLKSLDELLAKADIVTLHIPRTKETTNLLSEARMRSMKPGAYVINAARGGLVDEDALLRLLDEGHLAGAALDTFATEPLQADSPLRAHPKLILTPHLGASTSEAQQAVSTILARQIIDFVDTGAVAGCVNLPPLTAEAAREVGPWMPLMSALGKLAARLVPAPTRLADHLRRAHRSAGHAAADAPAGGRAARHALGPRHAGERAAGSRRARPDVAETLGGDGDGFDRLLRLQGRVGDHRTREIEATLHRGPRVVRLDGVELDFDPQAHMLLMRNEDRPGMIGTGRFAARRGRHQHRQLLARRDAATARRVAAITVDRAGRRTRSSLRSCAAIARHRFSLEHGVNACASCSPATAKRRGMPKAATRARKTSRCRRSAMRRRARSANACATCRSPARWPRRWRARGTPPSSRWASATLHADARSRA